MCIAAGILNTMRHLVPAMVEKGSGLIVNISSGTGHSTFDASGNGARACCWGASASAFASVFATAG